jgi:hypothetical protein
MAQGLSDRKPPRREFKLLVAFNVLKGRGRIPRTGNPV